MEFRLLAVRRKVSSTPKPPCRSSQSTITASNFSHERISVYKDVYLSLGSNLDDRAANLNIAITGLAALGRVEAVSSFYETEPVGFAAQPWFLNCAVKLSTEKMPKQLLSGILDLERQM